MIERALHIKGFMSEPELQWLADRAREYNTIVEIGTYYGRSARALADNTNGKVYCIDPYPGILNNTFGKVAISSGEFVYKQAQHNLRDHIQSGKLVLHRGTVDDFPYQIEPDFVFIDGDHLEAPFLKDFNWMLSKVKKGMLSGHDYENVDWPAVKQIVDSTFPADRIGKKGFIWWTKKS